MAETSGSPPVKPKLNPQAVIDGRVEKGWTVVRLAAEAGLHVNTVVRVEGGLVRRFNPVTAKALSDALGRSVLIWPGRDIAKAA